MNRKYLYVVFIQVSMFLNITCLNAFTLVIPDYYTDERDPFAIYQYFVNSPAPLVSFDFKTEDVRCVIIDNIGRRFIVDNKKVYRFSELYFPFQVIDEQNNNNCNKTSYTNISLNIDALKKFTSSKEGVINQDSPFEHLYFEKSIGASVFVSVDAKFYNNFEDMDCLQLQISDFVGNEIVVNHNYNVNHDIKMSLPVTVRYFDRCYTSHLSQEQKENKDKDFEYSIKFELETQGDDY